MAKLNIESDSNPKEDESKRQKIKNEIDSILGQIQRKEMEAIKAMREAAKNKGLHSAEEATQLFDEALRLDGELTDPHKFDRELRDKQEIYDNRLHDIKVLQFEAKLLDGTLDKMDDAQLQYEQELEAVRLQRQKKIQKNLKLEKMVAEYQDMLEREAKNLEQMKEKLTPIKDISLQTTKRLGRSMSKSKLAAAKMKISLEDNDIQYEKFEMQNPKLSSTLIGDKHIRERARSELGEGESKWKWKVNRLYEGVDDLYTPSTLEMDQRAEIHKLFDLLKDCRMRTEKLQANLDAIYLEMRDIEDENIKITKEELALRLNSNDGAVIQIRKGIEKTLKENQEKDDQI